MLNWPFYQDVFKNEKFHSLSESRRPLDNCSCVVLLTYILVGMAATRIGSVPAGRIIARDSAYEREARMLNWPFYQDVFKNEKFHSLSESRRPLDNCSCVVLLTYILVGMAATRIGSVPAGRIIARDSAYEREARMLNWPFYQDVFKNEKFHSLSESRRPLDNCSCVVLLTYILVGMAATRIGSVPEGRIIARDSAYSP
ncbi:protein of unknown function [Shewanella benthica]|uniref:Uncharacterized protein n=1 Tax=Shewanella benthica TaxID=43661 RepID=A0A330M804_9GAMM|nr:protein of unknown function [Shewanella benthica]